MDAEYLSAKVVRGVVAEGRALVVLGEGLLELPEDEQARIILPLAARCVLRSRHPLERVQEDRDFWECVRKQTQTGECMKSLLDERWKLVKDARANLAIDAHLDRQKADKLVESWLARWAAWKASTERA
jgi:hypothetical protein